MLASVNSEFMLRIIDSPNFPEVKNRPSNSLRVLISFILLLFINTLNIDIIEDRSKSKQNGPSNIGRNLWSKYGVFVY